MEWKDQEWCLLQSRQLGTTGHHQGIWRHECPGQRAPGQDAEVQETHLLQTNYRKGTLLSIHLILE